MTLGLFDLGFLGGLGAVAALDPDAQAYITAVEAADGQALETAVRAAINDFVVGCKADGIWNAIKASCVLAGARTLNGALVPLVGAAPTNTGFDSPGYNRKTGLKGETSTAKYLNTNRNNNADPQNNFHLAVFASEAASSINTNFPTYIGGGTSNSGSSVIGRQNNNGTLELRSNSNATISPAGIGAATGLIAHSRSAADSFTYRVLGASTSINQESQIPRNVLIHVFNDIEASSPTRSNARLAFYSIGESLDLALLDARVTTLINTFAAVIP